MPRDAAQKQKASDASKEGEAGLADSSEGALPRATESIKHGDEGSTIRKRIVEDNAEDLPVPKRRELESRTAGEFETASEQTIQVLSQKFPPTEDGPSTPTHASATLGHPLTPPPSSSRVPPLDAPSNETPDLDGEFGDVEDDKFWAQAARIAEEAEFKAGKTQRAPVIVNRAPVLTLWVTVVALREGYSRGTALSIARYIATESAQAKGQSLGIIKSSSSTSSAKEAAFQEQQRREAGLAVAGALEYPTFGRAVWCVETMGGLRAFLPDKLKSVDSKAVETYLDGAFAARKKEAEEVMMSLAECYEPSEVGRHAYPLYEQFRPPWLGWGEKGEFDLNLVEEMAWKVKKGEKIA